MLGLHADTVVAHEKAPRSPGPFRAHGNAGHGVRPVLHGIAHQIAQKLLHLHPVGPYQGQRPPLHGDPGFIQHQAKVGEHRVEHRFHVRIREFTPLRADPRIGQQILDHVLHAAGGIHGKADELVGVAVQPTHVALGQQVEKTGDLAQRFLQVVRGDVGKLLKLGVGAAQFLGLAFQVQFRFLALGHVAPRGVDQAFFRQRHEGPGQPAVHPVLAAEAVFDHGIHRPAAQPLLAGLRIVGMHEIQKRLTHRLFRRVAEQPLPGRIHPAQRPLLGNDGHGVQRQGEEAFRLLLGALPADGLAQHGGARLARGHGARLHVAAQAHGAPQEHQRSPHENHQQHDGRPGQQQFAVGVPRQRVAAEPAAVQDVVLVRGAQPVQGLVDRRHQMGVALGHAERIAQGAQGHPGGFQRSLGGQAANDVLHHRFGGHQCVGTAPGHGHHRVQRRDRRQQPLSRHAAQVLVAGMVFDHRHQHARKVRHAPGARGAVAAHVDAFGHFGGGLAELQPLQPLRRLGHQGQHVKVADGQLALQGYAAVIGVEHRALARRPGHGLGQVARETGGHALHHVAERRIGGQQADAQGRGIRGQPVCPRVGDGRLAGGTRRLPLLLPVRGILRRPGAGRVIPRHAAGPPAMRQQQQQKQQQRRHDGGQAHRAGSGISVGAARRRVVVSIRHASLTVPGIGWRARHVRVHHRRRPPGPGGSPVPARSAPGASRRGWCAVSGKTSPRPAWPRGRTDSVRASAWDRACQWCAPPRAPGFCC